MEDVGLGVIHNCLVAGFFLKLLWNVTAAELKINTETVFLVLLDFTVSKYVKMKTGEVGVYLLKDLARKSPVKWIILCLTVSRVQSIFDSILLRMEQKYVFAKLFFLLTKQIRELFQ